MVRIRDIQIGQETRRLRQSWRIHAVALRPDDDCFLATAGEVATVRVPDAAVG
jgi:hypothetical protein